MNVEITVVTRLGIERKTPGQVPKSSINEDHQQQSSKDGLIQVSKEQGFIRGREISREERESCLRSLKCMGYRRMNSLH